VSWLPPVGRKHSFIMVCDTLHLSDIDMIAGTPVLDIKPYIPEYDSPDTRRSYEEDSEPCNSNTDQMNEDKRNLTNLPEGSDIDVQLNTEDRGAANDYVGNLLPEEKTNTNATGSSHISAQFSLSKDLSNVLEEVKAFVNQDVFLSSESKNRGSDSPKTKPPSLEVDHPCYGEEAYTTIAGWIREPPVASLDVRFSLHAERELAEFIPAHLSGKMTEIMGDAAHLESIHSASLFSYFVTDLL
uniref:TsaA-like domain-containing protein n=1 Tax=Neolamprologus brichardi TaxID=32507 RepID=A0A3Q4H1P6_NEOBR